MWRMCCSEWAIAQTVELNTDLLTQSFQKYMVLYSGKRSTATVACHLTCFLSNTFPFPYYLHGILPD